MRRRKAVILLGAALGALAVTLAPAAPALAHGEEAEAAAEVPARTLVQQALALQTQQENEIEAQEKLELALESEHQEDVDIAAVREALEAYENDDHELAIEHMNVALGAAEEPETVAEEPTGEEEAAHEEDGAAEQVPEEALEHTAEFTPDRGSEEWIALAVGIAALALGGLGLLAARRRPAR